jgi:hypothetical protein
VADTEKSLLQAGRANVDARILFFARHRDRLCKIIACPPARGWRRPCTGVMCGRKTRSVCLEEPEPPILHDASAAELADQLVGSVTSPSQRLASRLDAE